MNPFSHLEDEKLMKLYQEDEFLAFEVLYQRHKDRVYSYIAKRTPKESDRDEIFQNTFLKVHKSKHTYKDKYLFLQWLYTVARSELLDYCKKKKVEYIEYDDNQYATEVRNDDFDLSEYKSLNDKEREALKLKFYSDEDYEEISVALNTSKANARKLISRALAKVRKGLTGDKS
ncbi:RNA polymerase sigma factor [Bacteriovorax sp. DB6_IX]|uniref:RNA polymerase sigma factor n=1 Tax=Bacteriovorax sp. DB6_IX TaxID=1353530 RepID=UPI000389F88F|nr:sigma-70 family RNA polymerase sigma factor [Bacteriovorax sp. DB6_IX]EQC52445.1 sigma-70 region 2 [Bacteriovorax sp. DB6_IX]